jgi:FkbM family methyltransferase
LNTLDVNHSVMGSIAWPNGATIREARARAARAFDPARGGSRRLVIFGAAQLGRQVLQAAARAGLEVLAYADNNEKLWGTTRDGVAVISPAEAVERFNAVAAFVVAVFNPSRPLQQLHELGGRAVAAYPEFFWSFGDGMAGITGMAQPEWIVEQADDVSAAYALLADDASRREFAAQIGWRTSLDRSLLAEPSPFANLYFDPGVFVPAEREVVVDCGAFNGDTLRAFVRRSRHFERYYALEPDPHNRAALLAYVAELPAAQRDAVVVLPYAVGEQDAEISFESGFGPASGVSASGGSVVSCRRLDSVIETDPTYIKMDIEGAELTGLRGAAQLIARARPVLSVVAYHYCEHLWQIPLLMNAIVPEYRLYLRRYAEDCWETAFYAVPEDRSVG